MLGHGRRVGVVQFVKGAWHTGEKDAFAAFGDRIEWHSMGEGFTWETQDKARDIAAAERAWSKARELMADPTHRAGHPRRAQHRAALRLSRPRRGRRGAAGAARRSARRRHRPQRQAGADRRRRPGHRDDAGQASFRGRREGAKGHRVLGAYVDVGALRCPPLSCRTSPPQGGRSAGRFGFRQLVQRR